MRLVDYFAVVGFDFDKKEEPYTGKLLVKVPDQDWNDEPFIQGLHLFCQPAGWYLQDEQSPPKFFVCVLTDEKGFRHYCSVLSFTETVTEQNKKSLNQEETFDNDENKSNESTKNFPDSRGVSETSPPQSPSVEEIDESLYQVDQPESSPHGDLLSPESNMKNKDRKIFAPKCILLISRHQDFQLLKNCLGLIYTVYIENLTVSMEHIIANLLTVQVSLTGASPVRFSIGAADKQAFQPPQFEEIPVTRSSVSVLLKQLGILNVLNILSAALVDQKLVFYSCSFSRLTETCLALTALMFPFKYSYPFIPILPKELIEVTCSPTPFLVGVHSSLKDELRDLLDVITVDLDGGVISIPECVSIPMIPEPFYSRVVEALTKVLCPDLMVADYAYPPDQLTSLDPERLDKEIRAIFLRLFSQLLMGYRLCLQVVRIHPQSIIRFQKEMFLSLRGFDKIDTPSSVDFMPKLLDSQAFTLFVQDHGPPYRKLSIFDRTVAEMPEQSRKEVGDIAKVIRHTKDIAYELYRNEYPSHAPLTQKVPKPGEGAFKRENHRLFPMVSPTAVQTFMCDRKTTFDSRKINNTTVGRKMKKVQNGSQVGLLPHREGTLTSNNRRLEVLRNCVQFIFDGRTLEIKKIFHAVLRALKSRAARNALTHELNAYAKSKPHLDTQQFDYICRLVNSALDDSSYQQDEFTVASDLLPALTMFYRKLTPTVMQFMYTVVQEHSVWASFEFWEFAFFSEIQCEICNLYQLKKKKTANSRASVAIEEQLERHRNHKRDNSLPLEIAATELQESVDKTDKERTELSQSEEGVIVGRTMHTAQRIIFMLIPLNGVYQSSRVKFLKNPMRRGVEENSSNSFVTNSISDSMNGSDDEDDVETGSSDVISLVTKFVSHFIDRACTEAGISPPHTKSLLTKIPPMVLMQYESLHDVNVESKRLPPIKKAKLLQPKLLPGEYLALEKPLRVYLATDGRMTAHGGNIGGPLLLPAEGAIFLTNYRLIFIGTPCDALASEQVVIRSFPTSALFKVKSFHTSDHARIQSIDDNLQHGVVVRSTTFQLLVMVYDEDEVTEQQRSMFQQQLNLLRYPSTIEGVFALQQLTAGKTYTPMYGGGRHSQDKGKSNAKDKDRRPSADVHKKGGAKTFMRQAKRKAGMTLGKQQRFSRLVTDGKTKTIYMPALTQGAEVKHNSGSSGNLPEMNEAMTKTLSDKSTMDRLHQRACKDDYLRTGLISNESHFKVSTANRMFSVCRSYPAYVVIPRKSTDDSLKSIAHCHHQNRFPAVVWMHPTAKSVLVRASTIRTRTLTAMFKHGQTNHQLSDAGTVGSSAEEERFLLNIMASANASKPSKMTRPESTLFVAGMDEADNGDTLKSLSRSNNGFSTSFRHAPVNPASHKGTRKWGTLSKAVGKTPSEQMQEGRRNDHGGNGTLTQSSVYQMASHKAQLYVFGDKSLLKNMRQEQQGLIEFVPVDAPEPKNVRSSFKSLLKACLPIDPPESHHNEQVILDDVQLYRKNVEDSGWLQQVSTLLSLSGAVVDVMDIQGASAILALEDGWDATCQISSLAQIMMDPHYRTIVGFQTLIQKDWLSFGHRFSHRSLFNANISSGYTPIFLQFLDAVYQITQQFPMSFEFNATYLDALGYHFSSNRFTTFLLDSDYERLEAGILFGKEVKKGKVVQSLWKYLELAHSRSPVFLNPLYGSNNLSEAVLRPVSSVCRLCVWPFYTKEALGEGPIYDGLLGELSTGADQVEQEPGETTEVGTATARRVVNGCYDNINDVQPNSIKALLQHIERLNADLGTTPDSWQHTWKAACVMSPRRRKIPTKTQEARFEMRTIHKRSTVDLIVRGLHSISYSDFVFGRRTVLLVNAMTSSLGSAPISPSRSFAPGDGDNVSLAHSECGTLRSSVFDQNFDTASMYEQFATNATEVRTYEGHLWKQGVMMKAWKQRFFVLDTTKHQLRQYESKVDKSCKSVIDLKEVESVAVIDHLSSAPKFAAEKSIIELTTAKRAYHFIAEDKKAAGIWIDNIQSALQG